MARRTKPPFRADHVGSLIRPQGLRDARQRHLEGKLPAAELRAVEERLIREAVAMQERVGLQAVTDGEFRRTSFRGGAVREHRGLQQGPCRDRLLLLLRRRQRAPRDTGAHGGRAAQAPREHGCGGFQVPQDSDRGHAAPSLAHWFVGDRVFAGSPYADAHAYMADIARIYREEIAELASLGCTYVQIDEVPIPVMCDPSVQATIARRGEDAMALIDLYVDTINDAIRDRPPGMTVVVHMCRGNEGVAGLGSGGYGAIAERVFGRPQGGHCRPRPRQHQGAGA
jgi:5-methyltetrahydropteroyltriglutamate--homocysteine methyltransferase